ncbi:MAG: cysteine-rich CWC family protein [Pseudomonadota bacterium]
MTTNRPDTTAPTSRRLACAGCGAEFSCSLSGPCWCSEETVRLPMPSDGGDCLCRDCLRKAAAGTLAAPSG